MQKQLFRNLSQSSDGDALIEYVKELQAELVDIRNIPDNNLDIEKKARELAVKILQEKLIDKIHKPQFTAPAVADEYK